ncbi:MAG TPA: ribonuclease P protein component [Acidimicrobiia bacterium]|nr:ribonuclease P protein component [Acidimicrobiia bacterium]
MTRVASDSPPERRRPYPSLPARHDYRRVLDSGRRRKRGPVTVVAAPGATEHTRVGLVAGRGIGDAVRRNRARRRVRAALLELDLPTRTDVVVIISVEALALPYRQLVADLRGAIEEKSRV